MSRESIPIPEQRDIPPEYLELWEQHDAQPLDPQIWGKVVDLVSSEEGSPRSFIGPYGAIPGQVLVDLASQVRAETDPIRRYEIIAQPGPTGEIWFDILKGFSSTAVADGVTEVLSQRHWKKGLDLGTGTGRLAERVKPLCDQLVGLDRVRSILDVGDSREVVQADVTSLPFKEDTFDLVMSMGLAGSLNTAQSEKFYREIARVLEPNGVYIDAFYYSDTDELHSEFREVLVNAKGILADMIVDQVSGKAELVSPEYEEIRSILTSAGLQAEYHVDKERALAYRVMRKV